MFHVKSNIPEDLGLKTVSPKNLETYITSAHCICMLNNTDKLCLLCENRLVKEVNRN